MCWEKSYLFYHQYWSYVRLLTESEAQAIYNIPHHHAKNINWLYIEVEMNSEIINVVIKLSHLQLIICMKRCYPIYVTWVLYVPVFYWWQTSIYPLKQNATKRLSHAYSSHELQGQISMTDLSLNSFSLCFISVSNWIGNML